MRKNVIILGSTGSIGVNALEVLSMHRESFDVFALAANSSVDCLLDQCKKFKPKYAHINKEENAKLLATSLKKLKIETEILFGKDSLNKLVSLKEVDTVVCAIAGSAGLESSLNAVRSGKKILLANKESLVMCGSLFMDLAVKNNSIISLHLLSTLLYLDSIDSSLFLILTSQLKLSLQIKFVYSFLILSIE